MSSKPIAVPESEQKIAAMFDRIAPRYDLLNRLLSGRQDVRWRRHMINQIDVPAANSTYLDVATGTGDVLVEVMKRRPSFSRFIGVDISQQMLKYAEPKVQRAAQGKSFELGCVSAEALQQADASVSCLTISFGLRNVVNKVIALNEFARVIKSNGQLFILEFFTPPAGFITRTFEFYFRNILPRIGSLFSDRSAYEYLPQSVAGFYSIGELAAALDQNGFHHIKVKKFLFGWCCLVSARRK